MRLACVPKSQSKICLRRVQMSWQLTRHTSSVVPRGLTSGPARFQNRSVRKWIWRSAISSHRADGDIFVSESRANQIKVLRDLKSSGKPEITEIFAEHD